MFMGNPYKAQAIETFKKRTTCMQPNKTLKLLERKKREVIFYLYAACLLLTPLSLAEAGENPATTLN